MNVNSSHKCLFHTHTRRIAMGVGHMQIWEQGIPKQCLSYRFEVLVNFGEVFVLFHGDFILDFEYSLFNVIKWYHMAYLSGTSNKLLYLWVLLQSISLQLCQWLPLYGAFHKYLSISCCGDLIFNIYFFITVSIWKTSSMSLVSFNNRSFLYIILFYCWI